jgi:hypothetical protein
MSGGSTPYTIATALDRARENDVPVQLLVQGQWITGHVVAADGSCLLLAAAGHEHTVVRAEAVKAVKIGTSAPRRPYV